MLSKTFLTAILLALNSSVSLASPAQNLEPRADKVCNAGVFATLVPSLGRIAAVQSYCSQVYPVKCRGGKAVATKNPALPAALKKLKSDVVATLCACIQGPPKVSWSSQHEACRCEAHCLIIRCSRAEADLFVQACTTQSTTKTTVTPMNTPITTSSTITTTSANPPAHTINAPRCDSATANDVILNGGCSEQCTCEPESETGSYYCGSSTDNVSCTTSAECPQGQYCAANSVSCNSGDVPGDECTSTFQPSNRKRELFPVFGRM